MWNWILVLLKLLALLMGREEEESERVVEPLSTATTTIVEEAVEEPSTTPSPRYIGQRDDNVLACIRSYEGDYDSDTGNGYYGAYQFDLDTWESVGGRGNPAHAGKEEQDMRAWKLYEERGLQPWPTPEKMCR